MERITVKMLENLATQINQITGQSHASYTRLNDSTLVSAVGHYYVDGAYGGRSLRQIESEGGGESDVFRCGHVTRRDLFNRMQAFIEGAHATRKLMPMP